MARVAPVMCCPPGSWTGGAGQDAGALPAEPSLLRATEGEHRHLVAPSRRRCGMRLSVFRGESPCVLAGVPSRDLGNRRFDPEAVEKASGVEAEE